MTSRTSATVASIAAVIAAIAAVLSVTVDFDEGGTRVQVAFGERQGEVVTIGKAASPEEPVVVADANNQVEVDELADSADPDIGELGPGIHEDARDETPPGAPENAPELVLESPTGAIGEPKPAVGAQNYSCPQRFVVNHSARAAGSKVLSFKLHVAVARAGALPVIRRLFNTPSFGASSHLGLDQDGSCEQWVPWNRKAWTQGAFNSTSESIEIMARGTESRAEWLAMPILKNGILASIVADRLRARGLPPRLVDPAGCTDVAGYTDHDRLECGNTHVDVGDGFPFDVFHRQVRRAYFGGEVVLPRCTVANVKRRLNSHRHHWAGPPSPKLRIDDRYGARARREVRRFQRNHGLVPDGLVGPATGRVLRLAGCVAE